MAMAMAQGPPASAFFSMQAYPFIPAGLLTTVGGGGVCVHDTLIGAWMDPSLTSLTENLRVAGPAVTRQRLTYVPVSPAADNATFQTGIERHWINHQGLCLVYASNTAGHVSNGFWPSPGYVEKIKAGQQFDAECAATQTLEGRVLSEHGGRFKFNAQFGTQIVACDFFPVEPLPDHPCLLRC
jgi:hypothetical protein